MASTDPCTASTKWALASGSLCEILNILDDHSRLCLASVPFRTLRGADPVAVFHAAAARAGYPAALLSDNAAVFSGGSRKGKVLLESELERLGLRPAHLATERRAVPQPEVGAWSVSG